MYLIPKLYSIVWKKLNIQDTIDKFNQTLKRSHATDKPCYYISPSVTYFSLDYMKQYIAINNNFKNEKFKNECYMFLHFIGKHGIHKYNGNQNDCQWDNKIQMSVLAGKFFSEWLFKEMVMTWLVYETSKDESKKISEMSKVELTKLGEKCVKNSHKISERFLKYFAKFVGERQYEILNQKKLYDADDW